MKEHHFEFTANISMAVGASFEEQEYQDLSEKGESREEYARRRVRNTAPRVLTMRIADDGIRESNIEIGDVEDHTEWEP